MEFATASYGDALLASAMAVLLLPQMPQGVQVSERASYLCICALHCVGAHCFAGDLAGTLDLTNMLHIVLHWCVQRSCLPSYLHECLMTEWHMWV